MSSPSVKCVGVHLGMIGFVVMVTQLNLNLIRNSCKFMKFLPSFVERILDNSIVTRILCLPAKVTQPRSSNLINEDDDEEHITSVTVVQGSAAGDVPLTNQVIVSELIDRALFLSYILFLAFFHS